MLEAVKVQHVPSKSANAAHVCSSLQQILEMFLSANKIKLKSGGEEKLKRVRMHLLL
jgi:uncharacterized protein YggU (UPF0235/DUF167 family)